MEASVAAGGAPAEGGEPGGEQQAPQVDFSPVLDRFGELENRLGQFEQRLPAPPEPEAVDEFAGLDLDGLLEPSGEMDPEAALRLMSQISSQQNQRAVQEAVAPLMERIEGMQINLDADALVTKYPQLADPAVHGPIVTQARELAQRLGDPSLASKSQFIEVMFQAEQARKYAAGEVPAGSEQFELENAGGGAPGASEPNVAESIVNARPRNQFWGV